MIVFRPNTGWLTVTLPALAGSAGAAGQAGVSRFVPAEAGGLQTADIMRRIGRIRIVIAVRGIVEKYILSSRLSSVFGVLQENQQLSRIRIYFGSMTVSITWITPFEVKMSVFVTWALSTITPPFVVLIVRLSPSTVFAESSFTTSSAITLPATT